MTNKKPKNASSKKMKPSIKIVAQAKERAMKGAQKLINQLPKAVEKSPFLQNTLTMIMEMQQQAKSIKKDANEEVHKLLEVLQHSYNDIETQARKVGGEAKKQAKDGVHQLLEKWEQKKGKLPKKFVGEMDQLLTQVGLVKNAKTTSDKSKATAKPAAKAKSAARSAAPATKKSAVTKKPSSAKASGATKAKSPAPKKPSAPKKLVIKKVVPTSNA